MDSERDNPQRAADGGGERSGPRPEVPRPISADADASAGAKPSNTAPANCNQIHQAAQIIRCGVDSLYLSYPGLLDPARFDQLDQLKTLAQSNEVEERAQSTYHWGDHAFEVLPRGVGAFPFILADGWYRIQVSRGKVLSACLCTIGK